jgi:heat shock protein HslJ
MKNIVTLFLAVFALLFLANCTSQTTNSENVEREWMLVEFQNFTKDKLVAHKAHLNLTNLKDNGKFTAKMGCNNLFGSATFNAVGTVKFSQIGSTMMFCDQAMDLETAFSKALPMMTNYKIEGHYLTLSDRNGNWMKFVAADWD